MQSLNLLNRKHHQNSLLILLTHGCVYAVDSLLMSGYMQLKVENDQWKTPSKLLVIPETHG